MPSSLLSDALSANKLSVVAKTKSSKSSPQISSDCPLEYFASKKRKPATLTSTFIPAFSENIADIVCMFILVLG